MKNLKYSLLFAFLFFVLLALPIEARYAKQAKKTTYSVKVYVIPPSRRVKQGRVLPKNVPLTSVPSPAPVGTKAKAHNRLAVASKDTKGSSLALLSLTPEQKVEVIRNSKYPAFIDHIWERESTRGTATRGLNVYCADKGLSNEFGFYPSDNHCFASFEASIRRLERWYEVDSKGLSYKAKLCYYNGAGKVSDCPYLSYNFGKMN